MKKEILITGTQNNSETTESLEIPAQKMELPMIYMVLDESNKQIEKGTVLDARTELQKLKDKYNL